MIFNDGDVLRGNYSVCGKERVGYRGEEEIPLVVLCCCLRLRLLRCIPAFMRPCVHASLRYFKEI